MDKEISAAEEMPLGFGMALAQNINSMERFSTMSRSQQRDFVAKARNVSSKQQMQSLVEDLANGQNM